MPLRRPQRTVPRSTAASIRWSIGLLAVAVAVIGGGCTQIRLPAIDPTGACLFSRTATTTFALPTAADAVGNCANCLRNLANCDCGSRLGSCLTLPRFRFPDPAFITPPDPPPCPTAPVAAGGNCNQPCVPSAPCGGDCVNGPRAVLLGSEMCGGDGCGCKLPDRGKRGCILLSPQQIVAPVGGEVILLSGICGTDGYLQMNERLEWMLSPDSVGSFIQVGDDDPGLVGRLAGSKIRPEKLDPSYAIGVTGTKAALITRGNLNPADDVRLEKGQTWLSISSPTEGTSHVTVLAPDSECWDGRKATATIYWVDAKVVYPPPQIVPAGTAVSLTTRVSRSRGDIPARGWRVRYEILDPSLATFGGTEASNIVEVDVDEVGNATAQLLPTPGTGGTTPVAITVIRPGGAEDALPKLVLGQGQTSVTWSSPLLAIRAAGPETASARVPFQVFANLSNPGNQAATNVRVDATVPAGAQIVDAPLGQVVGNTVTWELSELPPQSQLDLSMTLQSDASIAVPFVARADGLAADAVVRVDVFRPSLSLRVQPVRDSIEAGQPVQFNVDITNTGDRPLTDVTWLATGDPAMLHEGGDTQATNTRDDVLNPGQTWPVVMTFVPNAAGRRCIDVVATASGGQRTSQGACVTVINPIPDTPRIRVQMEPRPDLVVGDDSSLYRFTVSNEGRAIANRVRVNLVFDPQFAAGAVTEGGRPIDGLGNGVTWLLPSLGPGESRVFETELRPIAVTPEARIVATAESEIGARGEDAIRLRIDAPESPSDRLPDRRLPPPSPTPGIPADPPPLSGPPPRADSATPLPAPQGELRASLVQLDNPVRVNDPIRYQLYVQNDSPVRDGEVDIQFTLPDGVQVERIVPTTNPEYSGYDVNAGRVSLPYIRNMDAGEVIEFTIVLSSNQPQTFDLQVELRSLEQPQARAVTVTTDVVLQ